MNSRERVLAALKLQEPDRVPFMDYFNDDVKHKIMGRKEIDEAEFAQKIGMDAIYTTDYVAPVFCKSHHDGQEAAMRAGADGGEPDFLGEGIIRSDKDLGKMIFPDPHDERYYDSAKRFIDRYGKSDLALYAMLRPLGLFNVIFSMPMTDFSDALFDNPAMIDHMMDRFIEWNCVVIEKLQTLGFDFFLCCNDMAFKTGTFVSPDMLREIFLPKMKIAADTIKLPWVFHSDGDLSKVMDDLLTLGMNGMNPFEPPVMDLKIAKQTWGERICLWGNIDLVHTLPYGTVAEVEAEVRQRIKDAGAGGGYICASANSVTSFCKIENVLAMIQAVHKYGRYPLQDLQ